MDIRITNGAFVHRHWGELTDGELLAGFQYESDALAFAKYAAERDSTIATKLRFVVTCTYSGKQTIVHSKGAA